VGAIVPTRVATREKPLVPGRGERFLIFMRRVTKL